jgi:hypothetical protein
VTDVSQMGRAELEAHRDFLLGSIADLAREHAAGDLTEEDYEQLHADYVRRAADCLRAIEAMPDPSLEVPSGGETGWRRFRRFLGRRRVRRVLSGGAFVCFLAVVGLFAAHLAGVRLPGQSETGSITLSQAATVAQDLSQAAVAANSGQVPTAVLLYDEVLAKVPDQPVALTYRGWLTRLAGLSTHSNPTVRSGDADLAKATQVDPGYPDGEGLRGVALFEDDHDTAGAIACFSRLLQDKPSSSLLADVSSVARLAYTTAGRPVPGAFAAS